MKALKGQGVYPEVEYNYQTISLRLHVHLTVDG